MYKNKINNIEVNSPYKITNSIQNHTWLEEAPFKTTCGSKGIGINMLGLG
jgi:hypothetical protein